MVVPSTKNNSFLQTQVQESEIKEDKLAYQSPLPNPLKMHAFFLVFGRTELGSTYIVLLAADLLSLAFTMKLRYYVV